MTGYACIDGQQIACTDPAAKDAPCEACGCGGGRSCIASVCAAAVTTEKLATIPAGNAISRIAVGATRVFVASSRSGGAPYAGDVYAFPKTGGMPTVFVPDAGRGADLLPDGDGLFVFSSVERTGSNSKSRLERVTAEGTRTTIDVGIDPLNPTDAKLDGEDIYLAWLGAAPDGSVIKRVKRTGGPAVTVATSETVFSIALAAPYVYWIGSSSVGVQRRRMDLSDEPETLGATEFIVNDHAIDPASSTAWWSTSTDVKRLDWSTKTTTALSIGKSCGVTVTRGIALFRTCDDAGQPRLLHFMPAGATKPTTLVAKLDAVLTVDDDYIYGAQGSDVVRVRRPDR